MADEEKRWPQAVAVDGGGGEGGAVGEEEEGVRLLEGMAVMDFDMLCSTVALGATGGFSVEKFEEGGGGEVQRMWEGDVVDCFDDRRIAIESACCPCYRFGKNMRRAGLGSCFFQGTVYFLLVVISLLNFIAFGVTKRHFFLFLGASFTMSTGLYLGYFRTRIRRQFNIRASDSFLDDCVTHLVCPCCSLCQESRTLEMNNVQDGIWRGRGETICIGSYNEGNKVFSELQQSPPPPTIPPEIHNMESSKNGSQHSWSVDLTNMEHLVPPPL